MKNNIIKSACFGFILFLFSCIGVPQLSIPHTDPTPPPEQPEKEPINVEVKVEKGKIFDFSMNGLKTGFSITISNKNTYTLILSSLNYRVDIEQTIIDTREENDKVRILAGETTSLERNFNVDFVNLAKGALSFADKKNMAYTVTGDCTILGNKETKQKSIDISGTIPVPQMPSISLSEAGIDTLDICGFTYNVKVKIENPNPFRLEMKGFNYDLLVKNNSLIKITNTTVQRIETQSSSYIDIPLVIKFTDVIKVAADLFSKDKLDFNFQGNMQYDSFMGNKEAPFHVDDAITLPKLPTVAITGIKPVIGFPPKLTITLDTYNPNNFDINITQFQFKIFIAGSEILSGRKTNILLNPLKTNKVPLDAEINASMLNSLSQKSNVNYRVTGLFEFKSILGTLSVPFDFSDSSGITK